MDFKVIEKYELVLTREELSEICSVGKAIQGKTIWTDNSQKVFAEILQKATILLRKV